MEVIRAEEMGMCFTVRDALRATQPVPDPTLVTIHGELVHNPLVARQLGAGLVSVFTFSLPDPWWRKNGGSQLKSHVCRC